MTHNAEKQLQHKIVYDFKKLADDARENNDRFKDLLDYVENIELPNLRKVCTMQAIKMKRELKIKESYEFKIII